VVFQAKLEWKAPEVRPVLLAILVRQVRLVMLDSQVAKDLVEILVPLVVRVLVAFQE